MSYRLAVAVAVLSVSALVIGGPQLPAQTRAPSVPAADQQSTPVPPGLREEPRGLTTKPDKPGRTSADPEVRGEFVLPEPNTVGPSR